MEQMTRDQAIAFAEARAWESMSKHERAELQIQQSKLCMPFDVFHEAIEDRLGRPVWTHELASPELLRQEMFGDRARPTLEEIMSMIPEEKRIALVVGAK